MSYAGDLTPQEAWAKLEAGAVLVDVRTEGEWAHIGIPDTATATDNGSAVHPVEPCRRHPQPAVHRAADGSRPRRTRRRAGVPVPLRRSAPSPPRRPRPQAGFTSYNVLEGFEGEPDRYGERTVNGWKNRGLPTNLGKN